MQLLQHFIACSDLSRFRLRGDGGPHADVGHRYSDPGHCGPTGRQGKIAAMATIPRPWRLPSNTTELAACRPRKRSIGRSSSSNRTTPRPSIFSACWPFSGAITRRPSGISSGPLPCKATRPSSTTTWARHIAPRAAQAEAISCYRQGAGIAAAVPRGARQPRQRLAGAGAACGIGRRLHRTLALAPDYAEARRGPGQGYREQGKIEEATACYRRAVELNPEFAEAHNNLGNALQKPGGSGMRRPPAYPPAPLELRPGFRGGAQQLGRNPARDGGEYGRGKPPPAAAAATGTSAGLRRGPL